MKNLKQNEQFYQNFNVSTFRDSLFSFYTIKIFLWLRTPEGATFNEVPLCTWHMTYPNIRCNFGGDYTNWGNIIISTYHSTRTKNINKEMWWYESISDQYPIIYFPFCMNYRRKYIFNNIEMNKDLWIILY